MNGEALLYYSELRKQLEEILINDWVNHFQIDQFREFWEKYWKDRKNDKKVMENLKEAWFSYIDCLRYKQLPKQIKEVTKMRKQNINDFSLDKNGWLVETSPNNKKLPHKESIVLLLQLAAILIFGNLMFSIIIYGLIID